MGRKDAGGGLDEHSAGLGGWGGLRETTIDGGGVTISMGDLRANMVSLKEILRPQGFRMPCASDKRVHH